MSSDIGKRKHGKRQFKRKLQFRSTASIIYEKKRAHRIGQQKERRHKRHAKRRHKRHAKDRLGRKKDRLGRKAQCGFFLAHKNGGTRGQYIAAQKHELCSHILRFFQKGRRISQHRRKEHILSHGGE